MYAKRISVMQHELGPLIDKFDECSYACTRLKKYVTIWNAESYEDLNWPKFFDIAKINVTEFERLSNEFNIKLKEMRLALLNWNPNVLNKSVDTSNPTVRMIGNLLTLPSSSLGGGP
jgi:hypothetical protein